MQVGELQHFLHQDSPNTVSFVRGSEKSGFQHLYLITASLEQPIICRLDDLVDVLTGELGE